MSMFIIPLRMFVLAFLPSLHMAPNIAASSKLYTVINLKQDNIIAKVVSAKK